MDKKFTGELRKIDPQKIIKIRDNNNFDNFFVILGLIFNDFKSLFFYSQQINEYFDGINKNEVNIYSGEYHGMEIHLNKLITSTIYEFIKFIENQSGVIKTAEFKILFNKLNATHKKSWEIIFDIANRNNLTQKGIDFVTILKDVRNNGSFHYYSSGQKLRNGYIDFFYNKDNQHEGNKYAYYSKGSCMGETRYFFCDAAMQGFHSKYVGDKIKHRDYYKILIDIANETNSAITSLMKQYIASRQ